MTCLNPVKIWPAIALLCLAGCSSELPPVPNYYTSPNTKHGAEKLIERKPKTKLKAVIPQVPPVPTEWIPWAPSAGGGPVVTFKWDQLAVPVDPKVVVAGYAILQGGTSGVYTNSLDSGTNLQVTVTGLSPGSTYYFAAIAYDTNAPPLVSEPSSEIAYMVPDVSLPPLAWLQIMFSSGPNGPWITLGEPTPESIPAPAYFKLAITKP